LQLHPIKRRLSAHHFDRRFHFIFNVGVVALGLSLTKEDGFQALANARNGFVSMQEFREHLKSLIVSHGIKVDEANVARPF
jgi:hypothetical protein